MDFILQSCALFSQGGPTMYLILLCSLFSITIAAERWIYYRESPSLPLDFINTLDPLVERGAFDEAVELCRNTNSIAAQTAIPGLQHMKKAGAHLERILESEASLTAVNLQRNLNHLESIITAAPLLGLLGTVVGMMNAFQIINLKSGQPLAITGGIGEALIATAFGLCTALIAMAVHGYFSHQFEKRITEMEKIFAVLIRNMT